ncbi:MAG TPA: hypothetical protein VKQ27_17075 [Acetobacteraceae bacterium]|nr:hypothetical protein [Acetobacteraceae bacterium]
MAKISDSKLIELAKRLFDEALASDTLKAPRAIGILSCNSNRRRVAVSATRATWRDYIPDAKKILSGI